MTEIETNNQVFPAEVEVREIHYADIKECLLNGLADFAKAPLFGLFFGGFFTLAGIVIVSFLYFVEKSWMIYPMLAGFPLIGPFAAVGLYEVSRRISNNSPLVWKEVLGVVLEQKNREIPWMAFVILFVFWIWMYQVRLLIALILGRMSFSSFTEFFEIITGSMQGWAFIIVGHIVGACFSLFLFSVTVVALPLLLERNVDFITAMITSVKTVIKSPVVMLSWGVFVTLAVIVSLIPMFLGLLVVLPVLGHTTWHIYKKAIV